MEKIKIDRTEAIAELEISSKQLKIAFISLVNKEMRIVKNPKLELHSVRVELQDYDKAYERFEKAKISMNEIVEEIRKDFR